MSMRVDLEPMDSIEFWHTIVDATQEAQNDAAASIRFVLYEYLEPPVSFHFRRLRASVRDAAGLFLSTRSQVVPDVVENGIVCCFGHRTPSNMGNLLPIAREAMRRNRLAGIVTSDDYSEELKEFVGAVPIQTANQLVSHVKILERLRSIAKVREAHRQIGGVLARRGGIVAANYRRNTGMFIADTLRSVLIGKGLQAIFRSWKPSCVVSTSDFWPFEYQVCHQASLLHIPSVVVQHGLVGENWWPFVADVYALWGQTFVEQMVAFGAPKERLAICGMPASDGLFSKTWNVNPSVRNAEHPVCLVVSGTHAQDKEPIIFAAYRKLLPELVRSTPHVRWKIKLHPVEQRTFYEELGEDITRRLEFWPTTTTIEQAILDADIVTTLYSGGGLEAMMMRRPLVVLCASERVKDLAWWPLSGGGVYVSTAAEFDAQLHLLVTDEKRRSQYLDRQTAFLSQTFANGGHAAEAVVDLLQRLSRGTNTGGKPLGFN